MNIPDLRAEIEKQGKIGSKQGLELRSMDGEGDDFDFPTVDVEANISTKKNASNTETSSADREKDSFRNS